MADTSVFEVTRQTHEEVERYVQTAVELLAASGSSTQSRESLRRQHQTSAMLDEIVSRYATLHDVYRDVTGDAQRENDALLRSGGGEEADDMTEFYARLGRIRDYHKKYPSATPDVFSINVDALVGPRTTEDGGYAGPGPDAIDRMFSGEEMGGRFLDLYEQHDSFLNLKGVRRITYLAYLDSFDQVRGESSRIPDEAKRTDAYRTYLQALLAYLLDFLRKTRPLADIDAVELTALSAFEQDWQQGKVSGWEDKGENVLGHGRKKVDDGQAGSSAEGIWCKACQRSFAKETVFYAHMKGAKHIKAEAALKASRKAGDGSPAVAHVDETNELDRIKREARAKAIARDETSIIALAQELEKTRVETRANVERKAALTERERQAEAEAAAQGPSARREAGTGGGAGGDEDDDDEEQRIYNPLKLPLGWDGKPIPFWLYKLHGLGVEYKCEICSDFVYQGRKNFERHFTESRHAFGMRALGLPNTKHFYEITRIEDALALADKLKRQGKSVAEEQGDAEEVEDEHGNIYTRKTYDLLKRQGLI